MLRNLLLNTEEGGNTVAPWIAASFPAIQATLVIIMAIASLILIIAILASPVNTGNGGNAITGASESFYTKHKGKSNQGRIRNLIIAMAITMAVCAILYFISFQIYHNA